MFVIGINHKTAPIQLREQVYLNPLQQDLLLSELKSWPSITEAFVLSTCNRTEVYLESLSPVDETSIINLICGIKKIKIDFDWHQHLYHYSGDKTIEHLLRVASGLDSLVLGEKQILGQVKTSSERSREKGMLQRQFNILLNIAIRTGKKAQTETDIACGGSSVSWAAITIAEQILGGLAQRSMLIIGAGKMGELALAQIQQKGFQKIYVMNRTGCKAEALAEAYCGIPCAFTDMKELLSEVDLCICSASAPHYIMEKDFIEKIMRLRAGRPLLLIDISMPRNIDPAVAEVANVRLMTIDDLDQVVENNMKRREAAISHVEEIIMQKMTEFHEKTARTQNPNSSDDIASLETA